MAPLNLSCTVHMLSPCLALLHTLHSPCHTALQSDGRRHGLSQTVGPQYDQYQAE